MKHLFFLTALSFAVISCQTLKSGDHQSPPLYIVEGDFDYKGYSDTTHWSTNLNESYHPMSNNIEILKMKIAEVNFLVYLGTWCGDSKRQVPNFIKILKDSDYPLNTLQFRMVDKSKKDKAGLAVTDSIRLVPTFIVYREGKEIGRIVETPKTTIEQDLVEIIMGE